MLGAVVEIRQEKHALHEFFPVCLIDTAREQPAVLIRRFLTRMPHQSEIIF